MPRDRDTILCAALGRVAGREDARAYRIESQEVQAGAGIATRHLFRHVAIDRDSGVPLGAVFEKVLYASPRARQRRFPWYREAVVYSDTGFAAECLGLRPPRCHGMHVVGEECIHLFLEDLTGLPHPAGRAQAQRLALELGRFGAWGNRDRVWCRPWLRNSGRNVRAPREPAALRVGLPLLAGAGEPGDALLALLEEAMAGIARLDHLRAGLPAAVAHMDARPSNIFVRDAAEIVAIDWTRCAKAALGEELVKVLTPWPLLFQQGMTYVEYEDYEHSMLGAYLDGLAQEGVCVAGADVEAGLRIRMLVHHLEFLCNPGGIRRKLSRLGSEQRRRGQAEMRSFLRALCSAALALRRAH